MSNEAINLVLSAEIRPPALKLLALCIANYANKETGHAWPGIGTLARDCSLSKTHVKRLLAELVEQQIVAVVEASTGGNQPNVYRLNPERLCTGYTRGPGTSEFEHPEHWCSDPGYRDVPGPGTSMDPKPKGNPKGSPLEPHRVDELRPPADAGAGAGDPWARLIALRAPAPDLLSKWRRQAQEHYSSNGVALRGALEQLIANPHWRDLPAPERTGGRLPRGSTARYDYTKGLA